MPAFQTYLDPAVSLEGRLQEAFARHRVASERQVGIGAFLSVLEVKDRSTYEHSVRVGLVASRIGELMYLDAKALLYAGLLHDVGKALTRLPTLQKTADWTPEDAEEMRRHVTDSFRLLAGVFDFSADVVLWHHRFQMNGYPETMPEPLHGYSEGTRVMIAFYGRLLALADCYDALHRVNSKFGAVSGEGIREKMLQFNPDQRRLIEELYAAGVLTVAVFPTQPAPVGLPAA